MGRTATRNHQNDAIGTSPNHLILKYNLRRTGEWQWVTEPTELPVLKEIIRAVFQRTGAARKNQQWYIQCKNKRPSNATYAMGDKETYIGRRTRWEKSGRWQGTKYALCLNPTSTAPKKRKGKFKTDSDMPEVSTLKMNTRNPNQREDSPTNHTLLHHLLKETNSTHGIPALSQRDDPEETRRRPLKHQMVANNMEIEGRRNKTAQPPVPLPQWSPTSL
ncbi:hypothetical protein PR048_021463 [Dryococelus australis]|uniref:Uncharacterized protein n=1 Tax=Dryococelus australis TaxID=614101 RepID=A0ABQ9GYG5_9NEOP|nr:hypothetical protein PR048_021463 [Dryococelus australis]